MLENQIMIIVNEKKKVVKKGSRNKRVLNKDYEESFTGYQVHFLKDLNPKTLEEENLKLTGQEKILIAHKFMAQAGHGTIMSYVRDRIAQGKYTTLNQLLSA